MIAIAIAEWAAGIAMKKIRDNRPLYMLNYSDDVIKALYNRTDFDTIRTIIAESWRQSDTVYTPFVEFQMQPYDGRNFTITNDGYRINGLSPQDLSRPGRKVFVFGGSTTMGSGVANEQTIPAAIERRLHAAGHKDVQVFNFGVVSYFSSQELIAFQRRLTAGQKPDAVVFIDGLNDFYYCTIPDQSSWYERLMQTTMARSRMPLGLELANRSNVVQLARALSGDRASIIREWGRFCQGEDDIRKVIHRMDTNRRMIDAMARQLGIEAIMVQQPVPTYAFDNSRRPYPVSDELLGYHINSKRGYPLMAQMRQQGKLWTNNVLWLDELQPETNPYIDTVHYSPDFNDLIGTTIAEEILRRPTWR
ncbi:SGNH/GDSL hydrolase family protein [Magnetospirillum sp. 64-120]|uniref:SGNH/GDSL hydrolase family protein n=1 Tax=Magnetospirillum sp. 64-120 TaxID=1895778 RepID=UPI0025BA5CF2|nr:SGNH/GDSL hydrolase family protein [Magnetospirillum sp. 64-120]